MNLTRRQLIGTFGAALACVPAQAIAQTAGRLDVTQLGMTPDTGTDQTAALQAAVRQAAEYGLELFLPGGRYQVTGVALPSRFAMRGVPGATILESSNGNSILAATDQSSISLSGLGLDGNNAGGSDSVLLSVENCDSFTLEDCRLTNFRGNGITTFATSGRISDCRFSGFGETAIHLQDSAGMIVTGNRVNACGNGGIRVWRYASGHDGTIVSSNQISGIGSGSGNGQNGNGINVFQADGVVCSSNVIRDCDFSALRANSTNDTIFEGNQCFDCREVAIFSEFSFSGSIIANNLIDRAATGISITNLDDGGHLAVCSGNLVRNITRTSPTNPDTVPVGIFAEADTAITGNVVENVPGTGIGAGWGPYLRNVLVSDNVVRSTLIGIAVSVADGAGIAKVSGNLITEASAAGIAGMEWTDIAVANLAENADRYPQLSISDNMIS